MKSDHLLPLFVLGLLLSCGCQTTHQTAGYGNASFSDLHGPYLGQTPPGDEPELFAPGLISTGFYERDLLLTPSGTEIYFGFVSGRTVTIMVTRLEEGGWTEPRVAPFASDLDFFHFEPALSPDGNRIYFLSNRPPAGEDPKPGWNYQNIWFSDRTAVGGWTEPQPVDPPVDSADHEFLPSLTRSGRMYFTRTTPGSEEWRLYRADPAGEGFAEPRPVPIATDAGQPVYRRLGYVPLLRLTMWMHG